MIKEITCFTSRRNLFTNPIWFLSRRWYLKFCSGNDDYWSHRVFLLSLKFFSLEAVFFSQFTSYNTFLEISFEVSECVSCHTNPDPTKVYSRSGWFKLRFWRKNTFGRVEYALVSKFSFSCSCVKRVSYTKYRDLCNECVVAQELNNRYLLTAWKSTSVKHENAKNQ